MNLIPMEVLTKMIACGWGSTRRDRIPADWHTRRGPNPVKIEDSDLPSKAKQYNETHPGYAAEKMREYRQRHPERIKKQRWRERQRANSIGNRESAA